MNDAASASSRRSGRRRVTIAFPYIVIVILCASLGAFHTWAYPKVGPVDEQAHIDYLIKVRDGHIPRTHELIGQEALAEEACRGFDSPYVPPPCLPDGDLYDPTTFQFGGLSAAAGHSPVYYATTALLARPISWLPGISSFVSAGRIATTTIWLGAAMSLLWSLGRHLRASPLLVGSLMVILATAPQVLHSVVTINPDATAIFSGALVLNAVIRWRDPWVLVGVAILVVLLKATNILALAVGALYLIFTIVARSNTHTRFKARSIAVPLMLLATGAGAAFIWSRIVVARALPVPPSAEPIPGANATLEMLTFSFLPPTVTPMLPPFFIDSEWLLTLAGYTNFLLVGIVIGAALYLPLNQAANRIGWSALAGMILGPTFLMLAISVGADAKFAPPSRYGLSLVPFLVAPLVLLRPPRPTQGLIAGYSVCVLAVTLVAIGSTNLK